MNDFPKWQFYRITHPPDLIAELITASATGPYPYPKDIMNKLSFDIFISFA